MNPIVFALRHPYTVVVGVLAVALGSGLALYRARVDVFPPLNIPVIYVCQPYGGMTPAQMEGHLTTYYEYHFLYVNGIEHVESKNIQGMALMKLHFHPGTDMAQAMAEVVGAVNRSRFMMPAGTVPPFISRLDTGSASVGYLVLDSDKLSIKEIQDIATMRIRPKFAAIPGISSPPAVGGNQRAIVVSVEADKLRSLGLTLEQVTDAVAAGNVVAPSGNVRIGDRLFIVTTNATAGADPVADLGQIPVRPGPNPVLLRDVAVSIKDMQDITAGYSLVNGRRSVYMLVTKRAEASTITVVNNLMKELPKIRADAPEVNVEFAFDQSPIVTEAMWGVASEGGIGAVLTGLMVLVFLRDWRSALVVVLNIPIALLAAVLGLWVSGQTINLMSLGGLALAVGILVDEATVAVENVHTQMAASPNLARAVRRGVAETAVPRLLALLCILSVFVPSFFMTGAVRELFVPLSLAVGFAMIASYFLSSTFVPVMSVWLLRGHGEEHDGGLFRRVRGAYKFLLHPVLAARLGVVPLYFAATGLGIAGLYLVLGTAIFPATDKGQFTLRLRAATGTRIERTEELTQQALKYIGEEVGPGNVKMSVGYVGQVPTNYPVLGPIMWSYGPEEVQLKVALKEDSGIGVEALKARLREKLPEKLKGWLRQRMAEEGVPSDQIDARVNGLRLSFEPGDLVNEVMSFGSPTAVEVQVSGSKRDLVLDHTRKLQARLEKVPELRDLQLVQAQDNPTVELVVNREKAATMGLTMRGVTGAVVPATASSRYVLPIYWRDPNQGQGYIVQVQVPPPQMNSVGEIGQVPVRGGHWSIYGPDNGMAGGTSSAGSVLLRDVLAERGIRETVSPAAVDRYNMRRMLSLTANVATEDLGRVRRLVNQAIRDVGDPPPGVEVDLRGQLVTLEQIQENLVMGIGIAVLAIVLLLTAYFQSVRLTIVAVSALPACLCGVGLTLWATGTTLNLQSFMGTIMALGVAVANAILLVTFAERERQAGQLATAAAEVGGVSRLRAVLMTSLAMIAGMVPMALGASAGGDQTAPLGRAVVGGLAAATIATLFVLPCVFAVVQPRKYGGGVSLDPGDPNSAYFDHS
jgi:multidrug efflux pump subunit AcrB